MLPSMLIIGTTRWGVRDVSPLCALISHLGTGLRGQDHSEKLCCVGQVWTNLGASFNTQGKLMTNYDHGVDDG